MRLTIYNKVIILLVFQMSVPAIGLAETDRLNQLASWMQGAFNSAEQARNDEAFFNIYLHMKRIWPQAPGSIWLYVEQAADGYLDKPYRQRVYELKQLDDNRFVSVVYTFPEPLSHAGAHRQENPLKALTPADLTERNGCAVFLSWQESEKAFSGSTDAKACESSLRGASYATSEVEIHADRILSWDRGYDAGDNQVWGAEKAGYVFLKQD